MQIGLFQLENLVLTRTGFYFFDLRSEQDRTFPDRLKSILVGSMVVSADAVLENLKQQALVKEHPIVLMCSDGKVSKKVAQKLESLGYLNVYVVAGGLLGLLEEA